IPLSDTRVKDAIACFTQPGDILCDHIQDRLNIRRRAGDDAENLARRGLLLQRLCEIAVAFLQLFEQPHVFDRDHSLIGESLDQLNLALSKWLDKVTPDRYGSNCRTLSQQWYCQPCPFAGLTEIG